MERDWQMAEMLAEISRDYRYTATFTGKELPAGKVMKALAAVARHRFVPPDLVRYAYENHPLPIGYGQTISQPYIVALMTDVLEIDEDDTILEIGTGCGYQTAVLAQLARQVYSLEIVEPLATAAARRLADLGYDNVDVKNSDGRKGLPEHAPYDGIIVTAAAPDIPDALFEQLASHGRMVLPIREPHRSQSLYLVTKDDKGEMRKRHLLEVAFVPLTADWGPPG